MQPVTVIIPAYNEAARITPVLQALRDINWIETIYVVDDGSRDNTTGVVKIAGEQDARIKLIQNQRNQGKGQSVITAWEKVVTPYLLMLDADLIGLTPAHLENLCRPVLNGGVDMTLGVFKHGKLATDFSHWITPWLTGQRCLPTKYLDNLSEDASRGYGLETALTVMARQLHLRVRKIALQGMSHPPGEIHRGSLPGVINRIKMYLQILAAWMLASSRRPEIRLRRTDPKS
jgi:polyisoprenyl-phosphate glycosyltransferase